MAELTANFAAVIVKNSASAVFDKIRAIKAGKNDQEKISQLEQLVYALIDDKSELIGIAQAYKEELVAQQISDDDLRYIIDNVVPALKGLADQAVADAKDPQAAAQAMQMRDAIKSLEPLLSVHTLRILQLLGFNYKRAVGEPLTFLTQRLITARVPLGPQDLAEINRLTTAFSTELAKVAQDEAATDRWERLRDFRAS